MSYTVRQNPASSANYTFGRLGYGISEIIIHHAATTSFDGIARTFQNPARQASAHYGVGRNNNVDQYVDERHMAWHCGNGLHNRRSVGIENVNSSGAPHWEIAPETFNTLAELVHDVAVRNGLLPLRVGVNLFGHNDVSDLWTQCPLELEKRLQELADRVNGMAGSPAPAPSTGGRKSNSQIADEVAAGKWGNGDDRRSRLAAAGYDYAAIQALVNERIGIAPAAPRKSNDVIASEVIAGAWGNGPDRKARLAAAGYDYAAIQALVNQKVGGSAPATNSRLSVDQVAQQVIAGAWGNGPDRQARLSAAGYDYGSVQSAVNRMLGLNTPARKTNDQLANEVIAGAWGNGPDRKARLAAAGYDYAAIQAVVNRKLGF